MATLFYKLFLWIYWCGAVVLSPFNEKAKRWLSGRTTVFAELEQFIRTEKKKIIWFHCASLGEFEQARPLLEQIQEYHTGYTILLSFFSPSGYDIRKNYTGAGHVTYLPVDSAKNAGKLLDLVKPVLVIWVKYEYWHFYLHGIQKRGIPLLLVSGNFRPDQPFFKRWGGFYRNMLACFSWLFVQNQASERLLAGIGFSNKVTVSGDTRFDRVIEIAASAAPMPLIEQFLTGSRVIVAGSTWAEDEEELDHFANIHPEIKFIIAPHEIDEEHLKDIEKLFQRSIRYSRLLAAGNTVGENVQTPSENAGTRFPAGPPEPNVLIIDNIGMLASLYKYATVAYVGGGFGNDGVHNVLEAAVYGRPVVFGPVYEKFTEAVELVDSGAAFDIENALELEDILGVLLTNGSEYEAACRAAADYVYANKGATKKILQYIQENRLLTS